MEKAEYFVKRRRVNEKGNNYMYIRKDTTLKAMMNNRMKNAG